MRPFRPALFSLCVATLAGALGAQVVPDEQDGDQNAAAAYFALTTTPLGALAPMSYARDAGLAPRKMGFRAQFGHMDEEGDYSRRMYAGGLDIPYGRMTLGLTAGYFDFACDDQDAADAGVDVNCKGALMGGASVATSLLSSAVGSTAAVNLGLDGALGFGSGEYMHLTADDFGTPIELTLSGTTWSAGVGLPVSLVAKSAGVTVVPMLRPGFAYGHARQKAEFTGEPSEEVSESGTRFMLGGGVGLFFVNAGVGLHVGAQKVFIKDGKTVIGLGLTLNR